jgi:hypothetical protein
MIAGGSFPVVTLREGAGYSPPRLRREEFVYKLLAYSPRTMGSTVP